MEISEGNVNEKTENDVLKVVNKLKSTFVKMFTKDKQCPVIETDFDHEKFAEKIDSSVPEQECPNTWYGTFEDQSDQNQCKEVATHVEEGLKLAREEHLKCEILIPCGLTMKIARDILLMSESEPCGIRGCALFIKLQEKDFCKQLVKVQCDPNTVSTFEIYLTLQEDTRSWCAVKKLMMSVTGCFKNSVYTATPKMLCLGYKLEKLKLYRRGSS